MVAKPTAKTTAATTNEDKPDASRNLVQRLVAVMGELSKLEKEGNNTSQKYKFISHEQVTNELRPLLVKHGVFILPGITGHSITPYETKNGARMNLAVSKVEYTIINMDKPEDQLTRAWVGEGSDSGDKGTNKSVTAAGKYFLMKMFNIAENLDPDAESHEYGTPMQQLPQAAPSWQTAVQPQQQMPPLYPPAPNMQPTPAPVASEPIDVKQKTYMSKLLVDKGFTDPVTRLSIVAGITGNSNAGQDFSIDTLTSAEADNVINFINANEHADILRMIVSGVIN